MSDEIPVLLSSSQVDLSHDTASTFQCDCACSDDVCVQCTSDFSTTALLRCAELFQTSLPGDHTLMFNTQRDLGAAVANRSAYRIWEQFRIPGTSKATVPNDELTQAIVDQMLGIGLLEPVSTKMNLFQSQPKSLGVWLHITSECNLRCDYCYVDKTGDHMSFEIGCEAIDAALRSARRGRFQRIKLKFAGGEPTLHGRLVLLLHSYAQQHAGDLGLDLDAVVLTNGINLDDGLIREAAIRNISIMVSLDGLGEFHDIQRRFVSGRGSFAQVSRSLDKLEASGIRPFISITLSGRNARGLPAVINFLLDRNLLFNINLFRDNNISAGCSDLVLREDEVVYALYQGLETIMKRAPERSLLAALVDRTRLDRLHDKTCGVGECYMAVDPRGRIADCQMTLDSPITNTRAQDPLNVLRSSSSRLLNLSVDQKEGCSECQWRYWCTGGCPLMTYRTTGRYDTKSPYCRIYQSIFPELLRLEGSRLMKLAQRFENF